jgi:predicted nucleotide-binding protein
MDKKTVAALQRRETVAGLLCREEVVKQLRAAGHEIVGNSRNGNDNGWKITLANDAVVNCFDSGTVNVQGQHHEETSADLGINTVFVIYGRDPAAKTELIAMLEHWNLKPLFLNQLPWSGETIFEQLDTVRQDRNFAMVLVPDDEGNIKRKPNTEALRAKQKVILQLGIMLKLLGPSKIAILVKDGVKTGIPRQIRKKLLYIQYKSSVAEARTKLAKKMKEQKIISN